MARILVCGASFWVVPFLSLAADVIRMGRTVGGFDARTEAVRWRTKSGGGVQCSGQWVAGVPGADGGALAVRVTSPATPQTGPRWFTVTRTLDPPVATGEADGIAIRLAVDTPARWWLAAHVEIDGKGISKALEPIDFSAAFETRLVLFSELRKAGEEEVDPTRITAVGLVGSGSPGNVVYLDSVTLFRKKDLAHTTTFRTNRPDMNLFEPGGQVELRFTLDQPAPSHARALRVEVRDYFDGVVVRKELALTPQQTRYVIELQPPSAGYYEVRAHWVANDGRVDEDSCIRTTGSLPQGRGTFAVMPRSLAENRALMAALGEKSFFGLHGDHSAGDGPRLSDYIGAAWGISGSSRWSWDEPNERPQRPDGTAQWAREAMAEAISRAPKLGLNNLNITHEIPTWARTAPEDRAPGFAWEDFAAYFRDYVRLRKLWYPHMARRLYDVGWETNLNRPLTGIHKPTYRPADVIELYRRAKQILDVEDPEALLVGPCVSSYINDFDWLEPLFEAGLLGLLGGVNVHGYHTPPPESSGIVAKTRALRARIAEFAPGRDLPLICSELGFRSQYGTTDRHKEQAYWHVRAAAILKGEGLDGYMPFYSYDYPGDNATWGICYNLDPNLQWGPKAGLSPKATVPALAVCIDQLEGARPVSDLRLFGKDVWGYVFAKDDEPVLCLWAVHGEHSLALPAGDVGAVTVTDLMGRARGVKASAGVVALRVGPAPVYIRGVDPSLYLVSDPGTEWVLGDVYAGLHREFAADGYTALTAATAVGPLDTECTGGNRLLCRVAGGVPAGAFPVRLAGVGLDGQSRRSVRWIVVPEPVEVVGVGPAMVGTRPGALLRARNRSGADETLRITAHVLGQVREAPEVTVRSGSSRDIGIPLPDIEGGMAGTRILLRLSVRSEHMSAREIRRQLTFLGAHERTEAMLGSAGRLPNHVSWEGTGASGRTDRAEARFEWDERALYITVRVEDDVFHQTRTAGTTWQQDSLQLAFDTHPEFDALYEPLASVFTKKVTQVCVAKTPAGVRLWRDRSHLRAELPVGDATDSVEVTIVREDAPSVTRYGLAIPWPQIGLDGPRRGKPLGIDLLVNDSDGPETSRRGLELFGGIMTEPSHTRFGALQLEAPLTWSPDAAGVGDYRRYRKVSVVAGRRVYDGRGGDLWLELPTDRPWTAGSDGGLVVRNARNVVCIGGDVHLPGSIPLRESPRRAFYLAGLTGVVFIEGVRIQGDGVGDVFAINSPDGTFYLQNIRAEISHAYEQSSRVHADLIQPWRGHAGIHVDRFTGLSTYQGFQIRRDLKDVGPGYVRRTNLRNHPEGDSTANYLLWMDPVMSPIRVEGDSFWLDPAPDRGDPPMGQTIWPHGAALERDELGVYATHPRLTNGDGFLVLQNWSGAAGRARQGIPPGGDYVRIEDVGAGYVSPGYRPNP